MKAVKRILTVKQPYEVILTLSGEEAENLYDELHMGVPSVGYITSKRSATNRDLPLGKLLTALESV